MATDTWDTVSGGVAAERKALHFALLTKQSVAQICRAMVNSQIGFSSDPTSPTGWGAGFDVGSNQTEITDLHTWLGEIAVVKQDSVYRSDVDGHSHSIQDFVGVTATPAYAYHGANSFVHGAYLYWAHSSGLWRFVGSSAKSIGFEAARDWDALTGGETDTNLLRPPSEWTSVAAYGQYIYATGKQPSSRVRLFGGEIRDDGTVLWHAILKHEIAVGSDERLRVAISEDDGPRLWLFANAQVSEMLIANDGGQGGDKGKDRGVLSSNKNVRTYFSRVDFGLPSVTKQLRRYWAVVLDWDSSATLTFNVAVDGSIKILSPTYSTTATGAKLVDRYMTPGTGDTGLIFTPSFKVNTNVSYDPDTMDPQILAFGLEAATPTIYRVGIPLTVDRILRGTSVASAHQLLRNLLNKRVTIKEPEQGGAKGQWTGNIIGYQEEAVGGTKGEQGWNVTLLIERYDYGS